MKNRKIICITPIKNESWIIENFIKSVLLWADYVIIADQRSSDDSKQIVEKYTSDKRIVLLKNESNRFNEEVRQKMLIKRARKIDKNSLIVALDADEFLVISNNAIKELRAIANMKYGTVVMFDWVNVRQNGFYWYAPQKMPLAFVDNGTIHHGKNIHSPRIPLPKDPIIYEPKFIKILHFQYVDWERMKSKHRWYQCWEKINNPQRHYIDIYRQYHHMYSVKNRDLHKIPKSWFNEYKRRKIDIKSYKIEESYWWDDEVLNWINKFGAGYFKSVEIWDKNWEKYATDHGIKDSTKFMDPRSPTDRVVNLYLKLTQRYYPNIFIVGCDFVIKKIFVNEKT